MPGPPIHAGFVADIMSEPGFTSELFAAVLDPAILNLLDLGTLSLEDTSFVDAELREHQADLLFSARTSGGGGASIYILFEHKSHPDKDVLKQLLKYLYLIHMNQNEPVPVLPIVFYHGPEIWKVPVSLAESFNLSSEQNEALGHRILNFEYTLINVNELEIDALRASLQHRAFLEVLIGIWSFNDHDRLGDYLEKFRYLFYDNSRTKFLEKLLVYLYRVQDIEPESMRNLIGKRVSEEKTDMALTFVEKLVEQGKIDAKLEDAKNFLMNGVELEIVLKSTGLTREQLLEAGIIKK